MSIDIPTFVIHCKKLYDRKPKVEAELQKHNFTNYEFYEKYDATELTPEFINSIYATSNESFDSKVSLWKSLGQVPSSRFLNLAEVSLTYKFFRVFYMIAETDCMPNAPFIIFEDDIQLVDDFESKFHQYLAETPKDWDFVFFGSGANLHLETEEGKHVYKKHHPASRCADSILVTRQAAQKIVDTYLPFSLCSDWEIGWQMYHHDMNVYWWEPSLVVQGSENGTYQSSLRNRS